MRTKLRKAQTQDFDYCAHLYFAGMEKTIQALNLNMTAQVANFRQQWDVMQVRIITLDGADIGWVQSVTQDGSLFLAQFFVDAIFQRQGIGSEVMSRLIPSLCESDSFWRFPTPRKS